MTRIRTLTASVVDMALTESLYGVPLASGASEWSSLFVTVLAFLFAVGLAVIILYNRWNRPDMDAEHAVHILTQLNTFGGSRGPSVVVRSVDALEDADILADIRGLFHGESGSEPTVRSASREVIREVRTELHTRAPPVSKVPARALQEAVLTALFGAIAVLPIAWWENAASSDGAGVPSVPDILGFLSAALDVALAALTAFPFTDTLFALGLSFGIIGAEAIWTAWFLPPVVLSVLAAAYWWLERRVETDRDLTGPSVFGWTRRFAVLTILTWLTGATLATIGSVIPWFAGILIALGLAGVYVYLTRDASAGVSGVNWKRTVFLAILGLGTAHRALAFLAALTVAVAVTSIWTRRTLRRWRGSVRVSGRDALGLDIIHSLTVTAAALTAPLMVAYVIAAFWTRKALTVTGIILSAPPSTLYAVLALAVVVALAAAVVLADRFGDVRRGIRRALSVKAVRAVVFARALPFALMVVTGILAAALGTGVVAAVAVSIAVGLIARFGVMSYNYITYRTHTREDRDRTASRVVISGRVVEDADGEAVYIGDVNGHRTAHRELDPLIRQVRRDALSLLRDGTPETGSFARYYYAEGVRRGKVDMESVADELVGDVRTRFVANVRQTDADAPTILEKLRDEYPDTVVQRVIKDLKDRGRVTRREDRFQWLG